MGEIEISPVGTAFDKIPKVVLRSPHHKKTTGLVILLGGRLKDRNHNRRDEDDNWLSGHGTNLPKIKQQNLCQKPQVREGDIRPQKEAPVFREFEISRY